MNILLDTHTLLWFLRDDSKLSNTARATITNAANHKFVSIATCWEISIKATRKQLNFSEPSGTLLAREIPKNLFDFLPIELHHVTHVETLPEHHKDPFDRLLVAQSLMKNMPLVSIDAQLDPYGVTRVW